MADIFEATIFRCLISQIVTIICCYLRKNNFLGRLSHEFREVPTVQSGFCPSTVERMLMGVIIYIYIYLYIYIYTHMSNEKNLGCLGFIGDYTTQIYRDYNKHHYKDPY